MKFGNVDVDETLDWDKWEGEEFLSFYQNSLKEIKETPEEIAKVLGVKVHEKKPKKAEAQS